MTEETIQNQICQYVKVQYPNVLFNTDLSGIKLPMGLAVKVSKLRSSRAFPDLVFYEPRKINGKMYYGLFIELKKDGVKIFKRNGAVVANGHIKEQIKMITKLSEKGYYACFAIGFDEAKEIIDNYFK